MTVSTTTVPAGDVSPADRSELRATIALALPIVVVQLGMMSMGAVDTMMAGRISKTVLAAAALGNLYFFSVSIFATGTLMALDPLVSQALGAGDREGAARAVQRAAVLAVALAIAVSLLVLPARSVFVALDMPAEIIGGATRYLHISIAGALPFLCFVVFRQSLQAMHRVAPIVWTIILANLLNAALNWVFLYGHLGSPRLGAPGSAIATAIARWAMAIALGIAGWRELRTMLRPLRTDAIRLPELWRMLRLGFPIGVQHGLEACAFGAVGILMGRFGTQLFAAHQVALTLASLTFTVPLGIGAAAAVRVGHAIGAGDAPRVRAAARAAYLCGVGFMSFTAILFIAAPLPLASLFSREADVLAVAMILLPIAGAFQLFDGAQAVGAGVLRGIGDTRVPLFVMLASYWLIGVPASAWLAYRTSLAERGLWWGLVLSLGAVAIVLFFRIRVLFGRTLRRVE